MRIDGSGDRRPMCIFPGYWETSGWSGATKAAFDSAECGLGRCDKVCLGGCSCVAGDR